MSLASPTPASRWKERLPADSARLIDGVQLAREIEKEVVEEVSALREAGIAPHVATLQVGSDPAASLYIRNQKSRLSRLGIRFTGLDLDGETQQAGVASHIRALNDNPTITGILVTLPVPDGLDSHRLHQEIAPEKDVEGVGAANIGDLVYDRGDIGPCTALAILEAIRSTGVPLEGAHAVIVGHSDIVGKPVSLCLLRSLATTTVCHIATRDLAAETRRADILIVAVGKPDLIREDMVKPGAVIIDVGINEAPEDVDPLDKDGRPRIVGDVAFEAVALKAAWITPVPGGIGPITVAMLARNSVRCARRQLEQRP